MLLTIFNVASEDKTRIPDPSGAILFTIVLLTRRVGTACMNTPPPLEALLLTITFWTIAACELLLTMMPPPKYLAELPLMRLVWMVGVPPLREMPPPVAGV